MLPKRLVIAVVSFLAFSLAAPGALAQLTDVTQTPNTANEGIKKMADAEAEGIREAGFEVDMYQYVPIL
jgi:hypothetical protein